VLYTALQAEHAGWWPSHCARQWCCPEICEHSRRKAAGPAALRTLDFRLRHGTHALEMQRRFLPSSPCPSFLLRRPFLAGASSVALLLWFSMAAGSVAEADVGFRGRGCDR
jgi:hypothetical protein